MASDITIPKGAKPITPNELCELADRVPASLGYVLQSDIADGLVSAAHELSRLRAAIEAAPHDTHCNIFFDEECDCDMGTWKAAMQEVK